jgi:hypothetical protein
MPVVLFEGARRKRWMDGWEGGIVLYFYVYIILLYMELPKLLILSSLLTLHSVHEVSMK